MHKHGTSACGHMRSGPCARGSSARAHALGPKRLGTYTQARAVGHMCYVRTCAWAHPLGHMHSGTCAQAHALEHRRPGICVWAYAFMNMCSAMRSAHAIPSASARAEPARAHVPERKRPERMGERNRPEHMCPSGNGPRHATSGDASWCNQGRGNQSTQERGLLGRN